MDLWAQLLTNIVENKTAMNLLQFPTLNHRCEITGGVREAECRDLLRTFFQQQRAKGSSFPE